MVGIIPKPIKKTSKLYEFSPYIVLGVVVMVILAFVILFYLTNKASGVLSSLQEQITQVGTADEKKLEAQVLLDRRQIDDFSKIFANHQQTLNFFKFLEENCHPKVQFSKLDLDAQSYQITLAGEASNFTTLGQQMALFQGGGFIKNMKISELAIEKNSQVSFTLSFSLDPKIFKSNE